MLPYGFLIVAAGRFVIVREQKSRIAEMRGILNGSRAGVERASAFRSLRRSRARGSRRMC